MAHRSSVLLGRKLKKKKSCYYFGIKTDLQNIFHYFTFPKQIQTFAVLVRLSQWKKLFSIWSESFKQSDSLVRTPVSSLTEVLHLELIRAL